MDNAPNYHHVQQGNALRVFMLVLGAAMLVPAVLMLRGGDPAHVANILIASAGIVIVSGMIFSTLTIQVTASDVLWWFGLGWPGGRISRAELIGEEIANPGVLNGIGLHLTITGWLWNVSLGPAIALHRNGKLDTILGTDDPSGLLAALRA